MIKVVSEVNVQEIDGVPTRIGAPTILVESHWNWSGSVVLVVEGKRYTVSRNDIDAAVANASNVPRFG
jgi:hypothetical protein